MKESIIKWQTGEPTKEGLYLVQLVKPHYLWKRDISCLFDVDIWYGNFWEYYDKEEVVAWCLLNSVEPYKVQEL